MSKKEEKNSNIKTDCYFYNRIKDLDFGGCRACEGCGALVKMVCEKDRCSFYKTYEKEIEDQEKYPFDRNYKMKLAMKQFERKDKVQNKRLEEIIDNARVPNTLQ